MTMSDEHACRGKRAVEVPPIASSGARGAGLRRSTKVYEGRAHFARCLSARYEVTRVSYACVAERRQRRGTTRHDSAFAVGKINPGRLFTSRAGAGVSLARHDCAGGKGRTSVETR
ncbi:unnamed protein product [Lampetra fluviatilis]